MRISVTPWNARNVASVMTNDGMPTRARSQPMPKPMTTPATRPTTSASHQDTPCRSISTAMIAEHRPPVVPADRSISPSSSTKTRPIAITTIGAAWITSASMLYALRKPWCTTAKTAVMAMRPTSAGMEPNWPPRTRAR